MIQQRSQTERKNIRLENYNYSSARTYIITICTESRANWFRKITRDERNELPNRFDIELDTFIVMPDHAHGIIILQNQNDISVLGQGDDKHHPYENTPTTRRGEPCVRPVSNDVVFTPQANRTQEGSLGRIVQAFKSLTTNQYSRGVRELGWSSFEKRLWERSFYKGILRDEREPEATQKYILGNPQHWLETRGL